MCFDELFFLGTLLELPFWELAFLTFDALSVATGMVMSFHSISAEDDRFSVIVTKSLFFKTLMKIITVTFEHTHVIKIKLLENLPNNSTFD